MSAPVRLLGRLWRLVRRSALERDMDEEMRFHVEMDAAERVAAGVDPAEARRAALIAFGGEDRQREAARDARGARPFDELAQDVRYGLRTLRRAPSYTVVAALTLALGIGANTAIFSVVDAVLLRPLPYGDPATLVSVWDDYVHPESAFEATRTRTRSYEAVGAYQPEVGYSVTGIGEPVRLQGARVSSEVFPLLGVAPALGRAFVRADEVRGGEPVVILSDELWRSHLGASASALGRTIELDGVPHTIIGVMPRRFRFPDGGTRLWTPVIPNETNAGWYWGSPYLRMIGRLRPGVTLDAATAEIRALAAQLRLENPVWTPKTYGETSVTVPLHYAATVDARPMLLLLLGAVGLVLLVACANVANLALARGAARDRELAVRAAIGAGRGRLLRQLLTESVLLAGIGAGAGLAVTAVGMRALVAWLPPATPRLDEIAVNGRVLLFALIAAVGTGVLFGIAPALRGSRTAATDSLRSGTRNAGVSGRQRTLARVLVTAEIALAVVLVAGAALLLQSFWRLRSIAPGFDAASTVSVRVSPPAARYGEPQRQDVFYTEVLRAVSALPGVRAAAVASHVPFDDSQQLIAMWIDGFTTDPNDLTMVGSRAVTPDYMRALGIPLLRGRGFTVGDRAGALPVAIVDRAMSERYWPNGDAIGGRIRFPWGGDWITVVGVAENARDESLAGDHVPSYYLPFAQRPSAEAVLVVATDLPPARVDAQVRAAVAGIDDDVPLSDTRTLEQRIEQAVSAPRFTAALILSFALLAVVLGAIGVYGVVAYSVSQRAREFGLRMALGASRTAVVRQVLAAGGALALTGITLGTIAALALTRFLRSQLFGIAPHDPTTFVAVPLLLGAVALLAAWIPARRAAAVDPMRAISAE